MSNKIQLLPVANLPQLADQPLAWSLKLWGEGKDEFSAEDWRKFYSNALTSNYQSWDFNATDQELLYLAIRGKDGVDEVVAAIALCDFDDFEELRVYKPWIAAFVVREDLRGKGVGSEVLRLIETQAAAFGIKVLYLWTEGLANFYCKRGYFQVEQLVKGHRTIDVLKKELS